MKNVVLLVLFFAVVSIIEVSLLKNFKSCDSTITQVEKTYLSIDTDSDKQSMPYKYNSPYAGEEDEKEDEVYFFQKTIFTGLSHSIIPFDKSERLAFNRVLIILTPYLSQIFTPPDLIC